MNEISMKQTRNRQKGLKYSIKVLNPSWFKKGDIPYNKNIPKPEIEKEKIKMSVLSKYQENSNLRNIISSATKKAMQNVNRELLRYWLGKDKPQCSIEKVSNTMKFIHSTRSLEEKTKINEKISKGVQLYWDNCDPESKIKRITKSWKSSGRKPNKVEFFLTKIIQTICPKEYKYSGDGQIWIAGKNPDWFNINGKKKLIEYFSNYYHSKKITGRTEEQEEKQRVDHFAKYGFQTLIVWEPELKNPDKLIEKILSFNGGS